MKNADKDEIKESYVGKDCVSLMTNYYRINLWEY